MASENSSTTITERPGNLEWLITWIVLIGSPILTVYLYWHGIERRQVDITLIYTTPLIEVGKDIRADTEILFEGEPVSNINKSVLFMKNTGNREIQLDNVKEPILFNIPGNRIKRFKEKDGTEGFERSFRIKGPAEKYLEFKPFYMEKGDRVTLEVFSEGPLKKPIASGEIIKPRFRVRIKEPNPFSALIWTIIATPLFAIWGFITGLLKASKKKGKRKHVLWLKRIQLALALISFICYSYFIVRSVDDVRYARAVAKASEELSG